MQQNDCNRTGHRQQKNNIQISNVQNSKNTIYNTDNYVGTGLTRVVNKYLYKVFSVPRLMSSVHEMDCLRKENVSVSGRSGAQSSVALTRR